MGTDLRIIQRVTKIINDAGSTYVAIGDDLDMLISLRIAGALGQADQKRQRSLNRRHDHKGIQQINDALLWGVSVGKIGILRGENDRMIYTLPLAPIIDEDHELPGAMTVDSSMFRPLADYDDATLDSSTFKYVNDRAWRLISSTD